MGEWKLVADGRKIRLHHKRKRSAAFHDQKQYRQLNYDGLNKLIKYICNHDFEYLGGRIDSFQIED